MFGAAVADYLGFTGVTYRKNNYAVSFSELLFIPCFYLGKNVALRPGTIADRKHRVLHPRPVLFEKLGELGAPLIIGKIVGNNQHSDLDSKHRKLMLFPVHDVPVKTQHIPIYIFASIRNSLKE